MNIGIIGSGRIGATIAKLFAGAGHEVYVSNSRGPESLRDLVTQIGAHSHATSVDEAVRIADIVLLAVPFRSFDTALPDSALFQGKIVIDAMNAYGPTGNMMDLGDRTSSEILAERLPGARVVKAFNTIYFEHLAQQGNTSRPLNERRAIFLSGDDAESRATVARLVEEIGFAPIDLGGLQEGGRRQQPGTDVYNRHLTAQQAREILSALA